MSSVFETMLEIGGVEDVPVIVHYIAVPASRGARDSLGVPLEPDEPAHIEIDWVELKQDGRPIELTTAQERDVEKGIGEWLDDMMDCPPDEEDDEP